MWRFILILVILYLLGKMIKNLFNPSEDRTKIRGNPQNTNPLDLTNEDVEDVDFEEFEDDADK